MLALAGLIIMLTAVGETKCTETNAGPGSENCKTEMPFSNFASCVFYVVVAAFTVFWCFFAGLGAFVYLQSTTEVLPAKW